MYIRCEKCGWSQDDFYDEGYNPASSLGDLNEYLFGDKQNKLNSIFPEKINGEVMTYKDVIALEYQNYVFKISNMKWTTIKSFKNDPNPTYPNCGSHEFIED